LKVWLTRAALAAIIILGLWLGRHTFSAAPQFVSNREGFSAFVLDLGVWGPLFLALTHLVQIIIAMIPGTALAVATGYIYGFMGGFVFNLVATAIASQVAFLLARRAGRPLVSRLVSDEVIDRWLRIVHRRGAILFLIVYLLPFAPADIINYVAGLGQLSGKKFLVVNLLGRAPGLVLTTLVGSHSAEIVALDLSPVVWIFVSGAVVVGFLLARRILFEREV
jgi:uncharacterized membrane protein YdjX (TVP38/TMEM64 family)